MVTGSDRPNSHQCTVQDVFSLRNSHNGVNDDRSIHAQALEDITNDENSYVGNEQKTRTGDEFHESVLSKPAALEEHTPNDDLIPDPNYDRRKRRKTRSMNGR